MEATLAFDASNPVDYYFDCISGGGNDSGWQTSTAYTDTGLSPETTYTYTVKARDASTNQNQTAVSTAESDTTDPFDSNPPSPDPMTWEVAPYEIGCSAIEMIATTASDSSGVEYYFDETTGRILL
jgi:chitodextrinase